jgi:pimeloyl-ACP methyl ester carboxylesterase
MTAHSAHLVLVPGLACTEDLFAEQIATLRGEIAISVAEHTRHDTMSAIARAVLATAPHRFALCGLSMGGYIAFEMVRQAPDRIERLAQTGEYKSVRDTLWPLFVHPARHDNVALKRAVFKMMDGTGPETFIRQQKAIMSRPDSRPSLGAIHCPTLVLVGNEDALTPVSVARTIADGIAGSKLEIVQECGHLSPMERPEAVTVALRAWIAR